VIVTFDYTGSAINGTDYITGTIEVTIPALTTGTTFTLTGLDDLLVEGNELITVDINTVTNATEYGTQVQNLTIIDDDVAYILMSVNTGAIDENNGSATFTLFTSGDVIASTGIYVDLIYSGTAIDGVDYITGSVQVEILAGLTGATFVLTGLNDIIVEGNEVIQVDINFVTNGFEYGTQVQNLTILDDDAAQVVLSVNTGAIDENAGMATFTVYTSGDVTSVTGIVIDLIYSGTGTNGVDYITGSTNVTIAA